MNTESPRKSTFYYSPDREDRVAAALRENLRKRKVQQQPRVPVETTFSEKE